MQEAPQSAGTPKETTGEGGGEQLEREMRIYGKKAVSRQYDRAR